MDTVVQHVPHGKLLVRSIIHRYLADIVFNIMWQWELVFHIIHVRHGKTHIHVFINKVMHKPCTNTCIVYKYWKSIHFRIHVQNVGLHVHVLSFLGIYFEPLQFLRPYAILGLRGCFFHKGCLIKEKGGSFAIWVHSELHAQAMCQGLTQDSRTLEYLEIKKDILSINHYLRPPCLTV